MKDFLINDYDKIFRFKSNNELFKLACTFVHSILCSHNKYDTLAYKQFIDKIY